MYKRTNYVVNRPFQYRLIAAVMGLVLLSFLLFSFLSIGFLLLFQEDEVTLVVECSVSGEETETDLDPWGLWFLLLPWVVIHDILVMIILSAAGIQMTNRIAGPVYHIQADIQRVLAGEKGVHTVLREGDHFFGLAADVNRLFKRIYQGEEGA